MERCATCKWWRQVWYRDSQGEIVYREYGECLLTTGDDLNGEKVYPDSLAWADGNSYETVTCQALNTMPNFGCVQHESRETDGPA